MSKTVYCWVLFCIISLSACFIVVVRIFSIPTIATPYGSTIGDIHEMSTFFGIWLSDEDTEGTTSIDESIPLDTVVQSLSDFIDKKFPKQKWVITRFHAGDAWGRKYNMEWRSKVPSNSDILLLNNNPILIWSSGANGHNEFGSGDDICDEIDWRIFLDPKPSVSTQNPNLSRP